MKKTTIALMVLLIAGIMAFRIGGNNGKPAESKAAYTQLPVGTVIASMLDYPKLCSQAGEQPSANPAVNTFMPCDGRSIVGSALAALYGDQSMNQAPDLRGKFTRGLNTFYATGQPGIDIQLTGDPDGAGRMARSYQPDEVKHHSHSAAALLPPGLAKTNNTRDVDDGDAKLNCDGPIGQNQRASVIVDENPGRESRPRNIAVYYYIKVN